MEINLVLSAMRYVDPPLSLIGSCEDDGLHIQHSGLVFDNVARVVIARESVLINTSSEKAYLLLLVLSDNAP